MNASLNLKQDIIAPALTKSLNPLMVFIASFAIYNLLGLIDFPWGVPDLYKKEAPWAMFYTALAALLLSFVIFSSQNKKNHKIKISRATPSILGTSLLVVFLLCFSLAIIKNGGIPLFSGEARFSNSAFLFNLSQLYGLWVLFDSINRIETGRRVKNTQIAVYLIGVTAFGYRTPALVFCLIAATYFIFYRTPPRKAIKLGFCFGVLFISVSAVFSGYRVSQDYDAQSFFKNVNFEYLSEHPYIAPLAPAFAMFDYSQMTLSEIDKNLQEPMAGKLLISNYLTFLPGKHWGARNIVGDIVGARWVSDRPMSITPTLQGALYIDFGYTGVFLGCFLIGAMIVLTFQRSLSATSHSRFVFSYLFSMSLMSIHNGYWDAAFVFFLFFLLLIEVLKILRNYFPKNSQT